MANHKSAEKANRQTIARTKRNNQRRSRIHTFIRKVEDAIKKGDKAAAQAALKDAQPEIMRGVTKGVTHLNAASRKISRLSQRIKAIA